MLDLPEIVSWVSLLVAIAGILLTIAVEVRERPPSLEVIQHRDEPTDEDRRRGYMWYHVKVRNKRSFWRFRREIASGCRARVSFLDVQKRGELSPQITAHWTNQPEPRDSAGRFQASLIPMSQERNVGFNPETFDVLIKFEGDKGFYTADPWVVYRCPTQQWTGLRLDVDRCVMRVEFEAANLHKRQTFDLIVENKGTGMADLEIVRTH